MAKTKTGGKRKGVLAKPKRPMSAYNFFFREERANILSESTKMGDGGEEAEPTSFEDIGRIIGQRWRAIDPEELAKYKDMAKKDSDRYRDEMKNFYNDELTLMCLGHNNEGAAAGNPDQVNNVNAGLPRDAAAAAAAHQNGGRMMSESQQMANLLQQQQQQQQQAMINDLALRQDLMVMLAQERARAAPAGMNPFQAQIPMNVGSTSFDPMGPVASLSSNNIMNNNIMNEDQILQLLMLQQQQGATGNGQPGPPNEAFLKIVLSQKNAIQERLEKLSHEAKTLHIKRAIMDKIVSKELGPGAQSEESKSSSSGLDAESLSVEDLFQLLQQQAVQTAAASGLGSSNSPSLVGGTPQPPGGTQMGPGGPSMQELLLRQQQAAANQPPPQMNNIHPSYLAQFMAAQASPQQHNQMFDLNGVAGMNGVPQGMMMNGLPQGMNVGMMSNGGVPGAVPGAGGNGVSAEEMIKKLMSDQNNQAANR